jgi:hypothetical protein
MNLQTFVTAQLSESGLRNRSCQNFIFTVLIAVSFALSSTSFAKNDPNLPKLERIGGNFTVTKIKRLPDGGFTVDFKASEGPSKIKRLHLESDHINVGLSEGQMIRLSADVLAHNGETAEISQVVVFIAGPSGPTPAWMLSKKATGLTPPARLIEMHAPSTDYTIF